MVSLNRTHYLVLNATTDDFEDLEQIYRSVCLTFSPERYSPSDPGAFYLRPSEDAVPLSEIVEAIRYLVDHGLLGVHLPDNYSDARDPKDVSYLWRAWFKITEKGRIALQAWASRDG